MAAQSSTELSFEKLNEDQRRGYRLAVEEGKSLFITGEAGTGKSTLVKFIIDGLTEKRLNTALTAFNGIAALNINGTTLCKWTGLGLFDQPVDEYIDRKTPPSAWKKTDVLIIDEISVVSAEMFDKIDVVARKYRRNKAPFGGMQLIVMGDFFQLPPVPPRGKKVEFCFMSQAWRNHIKDYVVLRQVIRQQDAAFVTLLREVRMGDPSAKTCKILNKRVYRRISDIPKKNGVVPSIIYSHKMSVHDENNRQLEMLPGEAVSYESKGGPVCKFDGPKEYDFLMKNCQATPTVTLKVDAQVMLVVNLRIEDGLVNGSRGVVVKLKEKKVKVAFDNGITEYISPFTWMKDERREGMTEPYIYAVYIQIPLMLAWAITAHKSQGLTISNVAVDTSRTFANGQTYVALSRATTLEGLYLLNPFSPLHAKTDPEVIEFYREITHEEEEIVLLSSSSSSDSEVEVEFSPHRTHSEYFDGTVASNNVTVPRCFDTHKTCTECAFVFCVACLGNMDQYCDDMQACYRCVFDFADRPIKRQRKR